MTQYQINEKSATKACVISPYTTDSLTQISIESKLTEAEGLAKAINLCIVHKEPIRLRDIKPSTYLGKGVLDRLRILFNEKEIELLIIDTSLTPIQQRNLEKELKIKVIDRTVLILEIFGERANTKEGKLQVELAHLTYQRSRLVRSWTHLERQRGGAGFLGGPGETQIELDRRLIDEKISKLKKELEKVKKTRTLQRSARKKIPYPIVALVGYTNAGKSSLFNHITSSNVFAKDLLFATLDPTLRKIPLNNKEILLSDTVGFISDLPHELIMAFRATLEEVLEADIVVHIRDFSNPEHQNQKDEVIKVLHSLGLKDIEEKDNYIEVLNKADLLNQEDKSLAIELSKRHKNTITTSASTGDGVDNLLTKIDEILSSNHIETKVSIPADDGKTISWLYENAQIISNELKNKTMFFNIKINDISLDKLNKRLNKES